MVRTISAFLLLSASMVPASLPAAEGPAKTAEQYKCELFPEECGQAAEVGEEETLGDAGATKGGCLMCDHRMKTPKVEAPGGGSGRTRAATRSEPARADRSGRPQSATLASRTPAPARALAKAPSRARSPIEFASGSAELTPGGKREAEVVARVIRESRDTSSRLLIEGHTDAVGSRAANLDLSQRRAEAVADYFAKFGIARERLEVKGYGFDKLANPSSPRSAENRRVEIEVVKSTS